MLEVKMVDKILNENNLKKDTYKLIANLDTIKDLGSQYGNILNLLKARLDLY